MLYTDVPPRVTCWHVISTFKMDTSSTTVVKRRHIASQGVCFLGQLHHIASNKGRIYITNWTLGGQNSPRFIQEVTTGKLILGHRKTMKSVFNTMLF
jgi:hypothetical protein